MPVLTGGADDQEGGGISRTRIVNPKVYLGIQIPQ